MTDPALIRIRRLLARYEREEDPEIRTDLEVQLLDAAAAYWRDPWLGDIDIIKVLVATARSVVARAE